MQSKNVQIPDSTPLLSYSTNSDNDDDLFTREWSPQPALRSQEVQVKSEPNRKPTTTCTAKLVVTFAAIAQFLFGYDTGVVSSAMLFIRSEFHLSTMWQESIVSVTIATAALFALAAGFINDRLGRRPTVMIAATLFFIGSGILSTAQNTAMLLIGRIVIGMGLGASSMTIPMYVSECSATEVRGQMVLICCLVQTSGMLTAILLAGAFSHVISGWRYMFGFGALPALVVFLGFLALPESPRWLADHRNEDKARQVLATLRHGVDVELEMQAIKKNCQVARELNENKGTTLLKRIFTTTSVRRALIMGCGLQMIQQLCGINTVMYYTGSILKMSGVSTNTEAVWLSCPVAGVNIVFSALGMSLVERIGRRRQLICSACAVLASLIIMAVGFQVSAFNTPPVTVSMTHSHPCDTYKWCQNCIDDNHCGFCYSAATSHTAVNGSCVPSAGEYSQFAQVGRCNQTALNLAHGDVSWAYDYCPTSFYWVIILGLIAYLMGFAPGMATIPWALNSEIYPLWARSTCISMATATNWTFNLVISMSFLSLSELLTRYGIFWLYATFMFLGIIFIALLVPETKGKPLEEMEELFNRPWCRHPRKR